MKTPEEMAEQYARENWGSGWEHDASIDAFLAGYKAAKLESMRPKTDVIGDALNSSAARHAVALLGDKPSNDDCDTPDLQEQIEALQQYMAVAQRKIMALQANVEFLLYHNKDKMGESEAIRRMQQTMQGFGRNNE